LAWSGADPVHPAAEPAGEDAAGQVLRPARGFGEAQGRVRGEMRGSELLSIPFLIFYSGFLIRFLAGPQVHRLVVNRDPKFTNFVEVTLVLGFLQILLMVVIEHG